MASNSFAEHVNNAKVMSSGMRNNAERAVQFGWSANETNSLEECRNEVEILNAEQEKLKADLKVKTAELDAKFAEMQAMMKTAKKTVKLGFPLEQWKEFGVTDKR